jgi:SOS response regulatory protein OraA/RecX
VRTTKGSEVRTKLEALGIRETDIDAAIAYARGKSR